MPLHIFLSTWIGTSFGVLELAKVFKDIVLVAGFALALGASVTQPWFKPLLRDKLVWLIAGYGALTLLLAVIKPTDQDAETLGVVYNLRFLLFFIYGALLVHLHDITHVRRMALKVVMAVALPVLAFGIFQYTLLPDGALTHVGYSRANGVLPVFYIDDKPDLERAMSSLRDPNSFGSYIIIILSVAAAYFLKSKNRDLKRAAAGFVGLSLLALWYTFSRSAWLGALVALVVIAIMYYKHRRNFRVPRRALIAASVVVVVGLALLYPLRNTYFFQNVVLHEDASTTLESSNELRIRFWRESLESAAHNPLGYGPGTAGLASIRNDKQVILNENYYLQILHEGGVLGIAVLVAIIIMVFLRLYRRIDHSLALALFGVLAGLAVTNFMVHIWSNEAVAYTFWGLAGVSGFCLVSGQRARSKSAVRR